MGIRSDVGVAIRDDVQYLYKACLPDMNKYASEKRHRDGWTCWIFENIKWYWEADDYCANDVIDGFHCFSVTRESDGESCGFYEEWGGGSPFALSYSTTLYYRS